MKPHKRNGRAAKERRRASAAERFDPDHKAQRWTCGHRHGEFIFAARCGMDNAPSEDRPERSPEERLIHAVFGRQA